MWLTVYCNIINVKYAFIEYYYVPGTELIALCVLLNPQQQFYKVNRIVISTFMEAQKVKNLIKKM